MKKKVILRSLIGGPIGLCISYLITILISAAANHGEYYPTAPELTNAFGNELNAVIIQAVCSLLYGAVFAGASVIWETDNWSILKQTIVHCLIVSLTTLPIAYLLHWMPHHVWGILIYFGIFFGIYFSIWLTQYLSMKKKIRVLNTKVKESTDES